MVTNFISAIFWLRWAVDDDDDREDDGDDEEDDDDDQEDDDGYNDGDERV